jgi:hypothetical protein
MQSGMSAIHTLQRNTAVTIAGVWPGTFEALPMNLRQSRYRAILEISQPPDWSPPQRELGTNPSSQRAIALVLRTQAGCKERRKKVLTLLS